MLFFQQNFRQKNACQTYSFFAFLVDNFAKYFSTFCLFLSATFAVVVFYKFYHDRTSQSYHLFNFINIGKFVVDWEIYLDSLTALMFVIVTLVSFVVHLYSIGYMHHDKSLARFMSYLSLFTFFMLALVSSDNFLQLFFGWEGVGVASYLLIGFWFKKSSANNASIKAFITNRVGDLALILGIALIYATFQTVNFQDVFSLICHKTGDNFTLFGKNISSIDAICLLLFIGAMGKSAQIGLHVWLADAMEGPTPVSALIHAATMVTAGVFLLVRCSSLFEASPLALNVVACVGAVTALFAATIAFTQTDIKKIIAYSTCSQLGYMFFACGVSAYSSAIFHLATHAFFKALLFLSAGSVIHALHHQQDITKMGGIAKKLPITCAMMWLGSLALAGIPPLAGYYSKDAILEFAFASHHPLGKFAFYMGIASAFLTAFYSWRLLFLVFHGKTKLDQHAFDHSIFAGYFGYKYLNLASATQNFLLEAIMSSFNKFTIYNEMHHLPTFIKSLPLIVGVVGIFIAWLLYIFATNLPQKIAKKCSWLYKISFNKWYFDEIYQILLIKPLFCLAKFSWKIIDSIIIDGIVNACGKICQTASVGCSKIQNGIISNYATITILSLVLLGLLLLQIYIPIIMPQQDGLFNVLQQTIMSIIK
ncbi:MAG: NADH-quinone oxidoreductase subunit L [Proteobacteria bacterium]|nr:NADH-quinone oxidoreductase subunit L [Pseudomonadota bacterium]